MSAAGKSAASGPIRYRVGDRVQFPWGRGKMQGVIVEDRGPIGYGGRRLYRIEFFIESEVHAVEIPVEDFEPADETSK